MVVVSRMDFSIDRILQLPLRKKTIAVEPIRKGMASYAYSIGSFCSAGGSSRVDISVSRNGTLVTNVDQPWIFHVNIASDTASQNVEIACKDNFFFLLSTKDIQPGEELCMWFSPELLAAYGLSFNNSRHQEGDNVVCDKCKKKFKSLNIFRIHQFLRCVSSELSDFWEHLLEVAKDGFQEMCRSLHPACPAPKASPEEVEEYMTNMTRSRNGERGHLCVYCGKVYSRKYGLKIHIRTHTGYKPLACPVCRRCFGDPSNLNKHVRLHANGYTPYRCSKCDKILVRKRDLERHNKTRHPEATLST